MIEYLENHALGCLIYINGDIIESSKTNLSYIKKLCIENLFTFEGYIKAVQKKFGKRYKIPLVIDAYHMLIPLKRIRDYDNIWINIAAITKIYELEDTIEIVFESNRKLQLRISMKTLRKQIKYLEVIHNIKVKHFHF